MKATVVGLVTPHVLRVIDIAKQAESSVVNVDWHLKDAVAKTLDEVGGQFNAPSLLAAYVQGLQTTAQEAGPGRKTYADVLQKAAAIAARHLEERS